MKSFFAKKSLVLAFLSVILLSSCTTQLAPRYDEVLFNELTQTNIKLMEFFASVSQGTKRASYAERKDTYNKLIGTVDALVIQSNARPIPDNDFKKKINAYLDSRGMAGFTDDEVPSALALALISKQLIKMKSVDMEKGLKLGVVAVFKNAVVISMDQAITYESFLNR